MAESPVTVSIITLPVELIILILSLLSPEDHKNFSGCSKACRDVTIPFVFRHIILFPENIHLWRNNPAICVCVKRLSLHALEVKDEAEMMDQWRICTNAAGMFPNVTGLKLLYRSSSAYLHTVHSGARTPLDNKILEFDYRLFNAIFSMLSTFSFYAQLRKLLIEIDRFHATRREYPLDISAENQAFLNSTNRVITERGLDDVPFPQGIEEAVFTSRTVHFTLPGYNLNTFMALKHCRNSLKNFTVLSLPKGFFEANKPLKKKDYIEGPALTLGFPGWIYPNVVHLCVSCRWMTTEFFYELPARFPRVQEFRVNNSIITLAVNMTKNPEEVTSMLREFTELKAVALPWPLKRVERYDYESPDWNPVLQVTVEEIERTVLSWLEDDVLGNLERAAFWWLDRSSGDKTYGEAVVARARKGKCGPTLEIEKIGSGSREELFPLLAKGWKSAYWID